MMQWWRCKHGAPFDTKWRTIARRVSGKPGDVWAVASALFDAASQAEPRGDISKVDLEEIADGFGYDLDYVTRIYEELKNKDVHDGQLVLNFERHQTYEDTTAADRKRRQRDREKKEKEARDRHAASHDVTVGHGNVTPERDETTVDHADVVTVTACHAPSRQVTPPDTDSDQRGSDQNRSEEGSLRSPIARATEVIPNEKPAEPSVQPVVAKVVPSGVLEIPEHLRRFPEEFERFIGAYPSTGEGKIETFDAWKATKRHRPAPEVLLRAVASYIASLANENRIRPPNNQRQPCHASRWLNEHRWERYEAPIAEVKTEPTAEERMLGRRRAWGGHPAVETLCAELGEGVYDTWFAVCQLQYVDGVPMLRAPSRLVRDFLAMKHMDRLERTFGPMVMLLLASDELPSSKPAAAEVVAA